MIRTQRTRLLMLASLSLLTTLLALGGVGKSSAAAVARNIESCHKLAHHLDLVQGLKRGRSSPPPNKSERLSPYFVPTLQT